MPARQRQGQRGVESAKARAVAERLSADIPFEVKTTIERLDSMLAR